MFIVGKVPIIVVGEVETHIPAITGIHGIGVKTPKAAAVAAATVGLASDIQTPNGKTFTNGLESIAFAAGILHPKTLLTGKTTREDGAAPKAHLHIAVHTALQGIFYSIFFLVYEKLNIIAKNVCGVKLS